MPNVDYGHHLAFPKLSESEVEALAGLAIMCSFKDGESDFPGRATRPPLLRGRVGRDRDR